MQLIFTDYDGAGFLVFPASVSSATIYTQTPEVHGGKSMNALPPPDKTWLLDGVLACRGHGMHSQVVVVKANILQHVRSLLQILEIQQAHTRTPLGPMGQCWTTSSGGASDP